MTEKNLLAELASHLFSLSESGQRTHALGARAGRAFLGEPRPDPGGAGDPRGDADRRKEGEVGHLSHHARGERGGAGAVRQGGSAARAAARSLELVEIRKIHEIKAAELACSRATEENYDELQAHPRALCREGRRRRTAVGRRQATSTWRSCAPPRTPCSTDLQPLLRDGGRPSAGLLLATPNGGGNRMPSTCRSSMPWCGATATSPRR